MKFLRSQLDKIGKLVEKGGKYESQYPLYEAADTFLYTPGEVTKGDSHVRDAVDQKRMMITVFVALIPCVLFALYNTGLQANAAIAAGAPPLDNWRTGLMEAMGLGFDPGDILACGVHGLLYFLPVYLVTMLVGGNIEGQLGALYQGWEMVKSNEDLGTMHNGAQLQFATMLARKPA